MRLEPLHLLKDELVLVKHALGVANNMDRRENSHMHIAEVRDLNYKNIDRRNKLIKMIDNRLETQKELA